MAIVGVLALQGAFAKHVATLQSLSVKTRLIRKPEELQGCDALVIPGGESTTMFRQIHRIGLKKALCSFAERKPVFGTCAGLILLAREEKEGCDSPISPFGVLDVEVERNGYGRQCNSFSTTISVTFPKSVEPFHAVFIRAPRIKTCGKDVKVLATWNGYPVLVRQDRILAAAFHPELTENRAIHRYFLSLVRHV